jgi:hypothetical protein
MPPDEMINLSWPQEPTFAAEVWTFFVNVNKGAAQPSPRDFRLACQLVVMWQAVAALYWQARTGCSEEEAAEYIAQMILDQMILYGSLAASE